jgi:Na+-translocating ferredoxin:NAD+ oxidoreductase RnfD subunit
MAKAWASLWTAAGTDGRHYQIAALGMLLALNMLWLDFGARPLGTALAVAGAIGSQIVCTRIWRLPKLDLRSALITGFSLSLLLRTNDPLLYVAAGGIAIASKFALRLDGKHIWNPATFAIVVLRYGTDAVWISPGQWGAALWFAALLVFLAAIVLQRSQRIDTAFFFLGTHAALLAARALWLGDPWAIPLHQLQSGSLLLFAFFMVTDPRTTPDHPIGRFAFAAAVAALGHWLAFFEQMREALYLALFLLAPTVPLLDRLMPAHRFAWSSAAPTQP